MVPRLFALAALAPLAPLAACATGADDYPSLAVRDAERVSGTLQPPEPYVPPPAGEAVLADAQSLVAQARSAHEAYRSKFGRVRSTALAARDAGMGSERWAVASVAIAELETERSRTMIALADLDRLYVAAATEGRALEELSAAQSTVAEWAAEETAGIDELLAALR